MGVYVSCRSPSIPNIAPIDFKHFGNRFQNAFNILKHIIIGKTNDMKTLFFQIIRPLGIFCFRQVMSFSIQFDHKFLFKATKIGDIRSDGALTTK